MVDLAQSKNVITITLLVPCVLMACGPDDPPLPPVVWEGQNIRARMDDPDIEVCGGTFEALDRHVALVREALLLEGDGIIEYSIGDGDFVDSVCSESSAACAYPPYGHVYTSMPFIPHELVHAARMKDPKITHLSPHVEEGLATLFGADWVGNRFVPLDAVELFEQAGVSDLREYDRAGQVMALLLERHGIEAFRRFDELAPDAGEDAAFEEVFGETKHEFALHADAQEHCEMSQWFMPLLECDGDPLVANAMGFITLAGDLSCDSPETLGSSWGKIWVSRHFRLDRPTSTLTYDIVAMPEDATLEIIGCDWSCPERFVYIGGKYQVGSVNNGLPVLEPGDYLFRMSRPAMENDGDGVFEFVMQQRP